MELFRGPNAADKFVKRIEDDCKKLTKIMSRTNKPLDLSPNKENLRGIYEGLRNT